MVMPDERKDSAPANGDGKDSGVLTSSDLPGAPYASPPMRLAPWERWISTFLIFQLGNLFGLFVVFGGALYAALWLLRLTWLIWPALALYGVSMLFSNTHIVGGREWPAFRKG